MLEVPYSVSFVAVVGYAYQLPQFHIFDAGLLLHFPQGSFLNRLSRILMSFRKIPHPVPGNKQIVSSPVRNEPASCIDFLELGTDLPVSAINIFSRNKHAIQ
jgi:hypothetical protein